RTGGVHHSALHRGGEGVPDDWHRLHRRPSPLDLHRRGAGAVPAREGLRAARAAPGREALMSATDEQIAALEPAGEASSNGRAPALRARPRWMARVLGWAKWFYPGMRVKRWMLVVILGILLVTAGVDLIVLMELSNLGDELNRIVFRLF